jgi:hypothetical protein
MYVFEGHLLLLRTKGTSILYEVSMVAISLPHGNETESEIRDDNFQPQSSSLSFDNDFNYFFWARVKSLLGFSLYM